RGGARDIQDAGGKPARARTRYRKSLRGVAPLVGNTPRSPGPGDPHAGLARVAAGACRDLGLVRKLAILCLVEIGHELKRLAPILAYEEPNGITRAGQVRKV